jgi:hypothetical protein
MAGLVVACALGVALAASAPVGASAAAATGNIPGVGLPGPVVSGPLGGPIYDVVYSVDVPAAHVLLLSLTGTAGTDFDLYLFDSSATDIYAQPPVGLVAYSTGPTSTEAISYPTMGGGRFYIDVSSATSAEGTFQLSVQVTADTTPPVVSVSLDGGAPATNDPDVTATVVATDDLSGVGDMQLSGDGVTWSAWQPYQPTVPVIFATGDGTKELWVRVRDRAGNVSSVAHATIQLITTPPVVVARDPDPASPVTGILPTLRVTFSEPLRLSSWMNAGLILQDASGTVVYGTYGWVAGTNTGTFTPATPLVPGAAYVVSLGTLVDEAGNPLVPIGSWEIRPMITPAVSMAVAPRLAGAGSTAILTGRVSGGTGAPVVIERSIGGNPWESFVTVFLSLDGTFNADAQITANTWFRADVAATTTSVEATSPSVRVLVRRQVSLAGGSASVTRRVAAGTPVTLTAVVGPADPPGPVTLSIYRYVTGRGYQLRTSVTRVTVGGRSTFSWHPAKGLYYIRLATPSSALFANGISPAYHWVAD